MERLMAVSYWATGMVVAYWVISYLLVWVVLKRRVVLSPTLSSDINQSLSLPKISVIVAAKDEETNIEACVLSMLDQDYPDYELIVIDDRSADRTPEILQQLADNSSERLKVIRIDELKEGWFGKNNAMREGVKKSSGDWLCFIDADCWQTSKQTLSITIQEALATQTDFLSVTPVLNMERTWEKIVEPACVLALMTWHHPELVNNPRRKTAYANGHFMLMSRNCYETIGGHSRVKNEMNEDIMLAEHTKEAGLRLRMTDNVGLFRSRMYPDISAARNGWSRILCGSLRSAPKLALTIFVVLFYVVLPWLYLTVSLAGSLLSNHPAVWNPHVLLWGGACLTQIAFSQLYYSLLGVKRAWAITFPIGGLFALTALSSAFLRRLGLVNTTWRGTTYCLHQRVETELSANKISGASTTTLKEAS
ncbi:hypothetical protein MNBD_PLANCTO02-243 [hydrothermal vent metagenome]|uniref:Glycosyltransferase 2-like domain-containing protein n=1 Tax=hydrothermal vent metagenome TaxID=652676 RepID=A0A3B1DQ44_9ZZZZ